jgi:hypothetical protein
MIFIKLCIHRFIKQTIQGHENLGYVTLKVVSDCLYSSQEN